MADEENRDRIRRMDLNLYLGLPRRLPEPDLGSDLALGSLPVCEEMSSSQTESNPSVAQSTQQQQQQQVPIDRSNDLVEYNPYSPSYGHHVSLPEQTSLDEQTRVHNVYDDPFVNPPYSPLFVQTSPPTVQDSTEAMVHEGSNSNDVEYVPYSLSSYAPVSLSPPPQVNESLAQHEHTHAPYIPASATNHAQDDHLTGESVPETTMGFGPYQADRPRRRLLVRDNSAQRLLLQYPEVRFRRLIDSNLRLRIRRFRSSVPYEAVADPDPELGDDLPDTGGAFRDRDATVSETSPETNFANQNQKASLEDHGTQDLGEKGSEDIKSGAANFDCNVCLDIAKEPVVTSCGHLFCWPCLYQWLHLHSDHKECPVCKGEVTESNVTPIYGRGNSEKEIEKKGGEAEDSSLKIPPRPHGHRLESFRQQLRRPLGSWRLVVDEDIHNRAEGREEPSVFTGSNGRVLTRLRAARRFHRDERLEQSTNVAGSGSSRHNHELNLNRPEIGSALPEVPEVPEVPEMPPSGLNRRGFGFWSRFAFYSVPSSERLAAIAADLSNAVGRGRMANSGNSSGASGSVNPRDSDHHLNAQGTQEPLVTGEQASASSTVAMIQGDTGGTIDAPAEPSSVGSSRTLRRRRRNSVSGSLDVDGGVHHASKRRRLN